MRPAICSSRAIRATLAVALSVLATRVATAQKPVRALVSLNEGWEYAPGSNRRPGDRQIVAAPQEVTLPHSWNATDATDPAPGYRRSVGWYRRSLDVRGYPADARLYLYFEGANTVADVIVNGRRAGGHVGGYIGFEVEITSLIKRSGPNDVLVRVSNADDPSLIPSSRSDFVIYGGLTRNVWLHVVPATHIRHVSVRTPSVSASSARATATVTIASSRPVDTARVEALLVNPAGKVVARVAQRSVVQGDSADVAIALPAIAKPSLWSPAHPNLYRLVVILDGDNVARDSVEEKIGFRWYEFRAHGPFYLNG